MTETTVIIPTYNRADVLPRAIESVLSQTYADFEIIVVDDGSTDATPSVMERYDDGRIRYLRLGQNKGANAARNEGISEAEGKYISFLDSDDEFHPNHLQSAIETLGETPRECAGVFTEFEASRGGERVYVSSVSGGYIALDELIADNLVGGFSSTTFRTETFEHIGMLDEELASAQDYDFFVRVLEEYTLLGIDELLLTHHIGEDRISDDLERKMAGLERIVEKHGDKLTRKGRSRIHYSKAYAFAKVGQFAEARTHFKSAILLNPFNLLAYYHYLATLGGERSFRTAQATKKRVKLLMYEYL